MRSLQRLWQDLAARDLVVGPVIGDFLLGPQARQQVGEFPPHAARVLQIGAVGRELVGTASAADPDIDPTAALYGECRHALRDMQRIVDWLRNHTDAETDAARALTRRGQG